MSRLLCRVNAEVKWKTLNLINSSSWFFRSNIVYLSSIIDDAKFEIRWEVNLYFANKRTYNYTSCWYFFVFLKYQKSIKWRCVESSQSGHYHDPHPESLNLNLLFLSEIPSFVFSDNITLANTLSPDHWPEIVFFVE